MLSLKNNSNTAIVVIHEIYGINKNITTKYNDFHKRGYDVYCPNLLNTDGYYNYSMEEEAYDNFTQCIGISNSVKRIEKILKNLRSQYKYIFLVGYSIGATIAWLCSSKSYSNGTFCFYGSRIRDFISIDLCCPVILFFAEIEKSFNVKELSDRLKQKKFVQLIKTHNSHHGFADQFSERFNKEAYIKTYNYMINFIEDTRAISV